MSPQWLNRINIPVWRFQAESKIESVDIVAFGIRYRVPAARNTGRCILALNVGGAIIPTAVSVYLVVHNHMWQRSLIAVA